MIRLVVCDLDNTLYDWVGSFVPAFDAMLAELVQSTGHDEQELLDAFRRVHQRHGTSEYALAVAELDILDEQLTLADRLERYEPALAAFRKARRATLRAYPDVRPTLERLREEGRHIVAHSDAMRSYALARLERLGLSDMFDGVWCMSDHELPATLGRHDLARQTGHEARELRRWGRDLRRDEAKPAPHVLREILETVGVSPAETVYVGDSLTKDIALAQAAGVADVFATYGRAADERQYQRLVDVSHWTPEQVVVERRMAASDTRPTWTIHAFAELLDVIAEIEAVPKETRSRRSLSRG
ncbi:MAG: HAD family hydrolase [Solirubrobacteraceae bacterium]|nr:HAD family hydrolase [Solirubrobacteraceae bacterium]